MRLLGKGDVRTQPWSADNPPILPPESPPSIWHLKEQLKYDKCHRVRAFFVSKSKSLCQNILRKIPINGLKKFNLCSMLSRPRMFRYQRYKKCIQDPGGCEYPYFIYLCILLFQRLQACLPEEDMVCVKMTHVKTNEVRFTCLPANNFESMLSTMYKRDGF